MENKEKKRVLNSYRHLARQEKSLREAIEINQGRFMAQSPKYDGMPHSPGSKDLADYAAKADELLTELQKVSLKKREALLGIMLAIDRMENEAEKTLLMLRYVDGLSFEDVAKELPRPHGRHYSYRQTVRLHGAALAHFMEGGKDERQ